MIHAIRNMVRAADSVFARMYLSAFGERNALSCFLFHSLFRNAAEIDRNVIDPLDRTTVAHLRQLVEYYLDSGYRFVTPDDIAAGLPPDQKSALITFDDGYFNNTLAIPVLEEFGVPALFFISSNHVRDGKCFWWDVLYRERVAQRASQRQIYDDALRMKHLRTEEIERRLLEMFGPGALTPRCDIDRPFTPTELRTFAAHPLVHLGNHTANHAILTNYSAAEVRTQIADCQDTIEQFTGRRPSTIAYPNGAYDAGVLAACKEQGIRLGFTVRPHKCRGTARASADELLTLGRFVPHAEAPIVSQCRTYRSDVLVYGALRSGYLRLTRRGITN